MNNQDLYDSGKLKKYYQPKAEYMPENMCSFEVYGDLDKGVKETGVKKEHWEEFDCSLEVAIEEPVFLD